LLLVEANRLGRAITTKPNLGCLLTAGSAAGKGSEGVETHDEVGVLEDLVGLGAGRGVLARGRTGIAIETLTEGVIMTETEIPIVTEETVIGIETETETETETEITVEDAMKDNPETIKMAAG